MKNIINSDLKAVIQPPTPESSYHEERVFLHLTTTFSKSIFHSTNRYEISEVNAKNEVEIKVFVEVITYPPRISIPTPICHLMQVPSGMMIEEQSNFTIIVVDLLGNELGTINKGGVSILTQSEPDELTRPVGGCVT